MLTRCCLPLQVKMIAINDAFLLEAFVFKVLKKHFRSEPYYLELVELFHDVRWLLAAAWLMSMTLWLTRTLCRSFTARKWASSWI